MFKCYNLQKMIKKIYKICNKYMKFAPYPKSSDRISKPSSQELTRLWFNDVSTTLVSIVEALENAPTKGLRKNDIKNGKRGYC